MANIEIYTKATCPFCIRAKALLNSKGVTFHELPIDGDAAKREEMIQRSGRTTFRRFLLMRSTLAAVTTCMRLIHVVDLIPLALILRARGSAYLRTTRKGFTMSEQNSTEMTFQIQRIYTKDISFEAPNAPQVFQKDWQPEVKLDLDTASTQLAEGVYEVVLRVTVTAALGEETAFLCEVQQGGIFSIDGIEGTDGALPRRILPEHSVPVRARVHHQRFPAVPSRNLTLRQ